MSTDNEKLDPALAKLFRDEPLPLPPTGVEERIAAKLTAAGAFATAGTSAAAAGLTTLSKVIPIITFVVGAGVGAAVVVNVQNDEPKERVVYIDRPTATAAPAQTATNSAVPSIAISQLPSVSNPPAPKPVTSPSTSTSTSTDALQDERILLDTSRAKLANGDPKAALMLIEDHERKFPKGRLIEEREAIAVQALVNATRYEEAKQRAAALEKRFPTSVYLPAVKITLDSIP